MAKQIIINLSDAEEKALLYVAADCQQWAEHAVKERCRLAMEEIVQLEVQRLLSEGKEIKGTKEEIVLNSPVKTAVEREQEMREQEAKLRAEGSRL